MDFDDKEKKIEEGPFGGMTEVFKKMMEKGVRFEVKIMDLDMRQLQKLALMINELNYICPDCPTDKPYLHEHKDGDKS